MGLEEAIWAEMSIENNQRSNIEQPNFWDYGRKGRIIIEDRFRKSNWKMWHYRSPQSKICSTTLNAKKAKNGQW